MTVKLTGLTAAEVITYHKEGRYISGFQGFVEITDKKVLKEKVKNADGFTIAANHDKTFDEYNEIKEHKDGTKYLMKIGLGEADYSSLAIEQADKKEFDAYMKKFGEASIKSASEIDFTNYKNMTASAKEAEVIVKTQLEVDIESINACKTKAALQQLITANNWTYIYDSGITLTKNKENLIKYLGA